MRIFNRALGRLGFPGFRIGMIKLLPSEQVLSHQHLLISDIISASIKKENPLTFCTKQGVLFRKVKINGVIVQQTFNNTDIPVNDNAVPRRILIIDDGTGVIDVHLSNRVCERLDINEVEVATSISIIADVNLTAEKDLFLCCKGYEVENDPNEELKHMLGILEQRKTSTSTDQFLSTMVNCTVPTASPLQPRQTATSNNMFRTLSSQPSAIQSSLNFLDLSPTAKRSSSSPVSMDSQSLRDDPRWHWSPDHIVATSTPLKQTFLSTTPLPSHSSSSNDRVHSQQNAFRSVQSSPLQQTPFLPTTASQDNFGFSDDSTFANINFDVLERGDDQ
ncbi:hypothetical protein DM01DRAFT_1387473 [Hesseltinella vesiculosa]|uniref:Uncharacterized protein n=1 Tax=Hesseltinella vesiculosa TaxID=101127 RepID=A0A1X2GWW3_9FUNG|nr:hypothetical protein DM01DRAFT_1387473 [Hesseltinella vesiculosa]